MIPRFLWLLFICFALSCQTKISPKNIPLESFSEDEVNPESHDLWSPEQRKANALYFFMLATDFENKNDGGNALKFLSATYDLDPNPYIAARLVATMAAVKPYEAYNLCKRMILLYPKDVDVNLLYGKLLMARKAYTSAIKQFTRVLILEEGHIEAYLGLIHANRSIGKTEQAILIAEDAIAKDASSADIWAVLAKLHLSKRRYKEALKAAKNAYDLYSSFPEFIHLYALTLELNGSSKEAVGLYETIFRLNPNNQDLISRMVSLYKQIGSLEEALELLNEAKESSRGERSYGIDLQIIFINWELRRFDVAARLLEELYTSHPDQDRIAYMAGLGAERVGKYERALYFYKQIEAKSSFYVHGKYRSILVYRFMKDYDRAISEAKKELEIGKENIPDFIILLANLYADLKQYERAVSTLESGTERFKDRTDIWFLLGINYERVGRIESCMETMKHIIEVDSQHAGAHNYLGYLYAERGIQLDEAEKLVKRALELKPNDGYYLDSLGWIYYQKKEYEKALDVLKDAIKIVPNEGVILEHIADTYKALGDIKNAREFYKRATEGKIEDRDRDRIFKKYQEIQPHES